MQIDLSRLEIKDILANLGPDAEPEVIAKLQDVLDWNNSANGTVPVRVKHAYVPSRRYRADADYYADSTAPTAAAFYAEQAKNDPVENSLSIEVTRPLSRADFPHTMKHNETGETRYVVSDDDIATINTQRATAFAAAQKVADARQGHTIHDFVETPAKPPAARVPVGGKNAQGDTCGKINEAGQSVFQCRNGHGYVEEGSVTVGCPQCFGGGGSGLGGRPIEATMDVDDPRVESF